MKNTGKSVFFEKKLVILLYFLHSFDIYNCGDWGVRLREKKETFLI